MYLPLLPCIHTLQCLLIGILCTHKVHGLGERFGTQSNLHSRDVLPRERVGCVTDKKTGLTHGTARWREGEGERERERTHEVV